MVPYIYDMVLILILLIGIIRGYRRGVMRTVLSILCFVIAFSAASYFSSDTICSAVYDKYFSSYITEHIDEAVDQAKAQAVEEVNRQLKEAAYRFIEELPFGNDLLKKYSDKLMNTDGIAQIYEFLGIDVRTLLTNPEISGRINSIAEKYSYTAADAINSRLPFGITVEHEAVKEVMTDINAQEALIYEVFGIRSKYADSGGATVYIENKIVRPIFVRFIGIVIWAVVFSVVNLILHIAVKIILIVRNAGPVKMCDSFLGAVLGAAAGMAAIIACGALIVLAVKLTGGMTYMNEDIFGETILFGHVYNIISHGRFLN